MWVPLKTMAAAAVTVPVFAYVVGAAMGPPSPESPPPAPVIVDDSANRSETEPRDKLSGGPTSSPGRPDRDNSREREKAGDRDTDVPVVTPSLRELHDDAEVRGPAEGDDEDDDERDDGDDEDDDGGSDDDGSDADD